MKLVFLYGPPASGKLTIAKELSRITGYHVFHNHLVANLSSELFPLGTRAYSDLAQKLKLDVLDALIKNKVAGIIMTFTYGVETYKGEGDAKFVNKIKLILQRNKSQFYPVKLELSEQDLKRRISNPDRKKNKKLTNFQIYLAIRAKYDLNKSIPGKSFIVNTGNLSAKQSAQLIRKHYKL